jgi:hypothetical protein
VEEVVEVLLRLRVGLLLPPRLLLLKRRRKSLLRSLMKT